MAPKRIASAWRVARIVARVFLAAAALGTMAFAAALYLFWRAVDVEKVRSGIEAALSSACRAPATVKGLLLTPRGLKLRGLSIAAPDGGVPALESRSALLTLSIPAIFARRRLELSTLFLYSPALRWDLSWRERYGWGSRPGADGAAPRPAAAGLGAALPQRVAGLPLVLAIHRLKAENAGLLIENRERGNAYRISRLSLDARDAALDRPFRVRLGCAFDLTVRGKAGPSGSLALSGVVFPSGLDLGKAALESRDVNLRFDSGPRYNGSVILTNFLRPRIQLSGSSGGWRLPPRALADLGSPPSREPIPRASFEAGLTVGRDSLKIWRLQGKFPFAPFSASAAVSYGGKGPAVWSGAVKAGPAGIRELLAVLGLERRYPVRGTALSARFSLSGRWPRMYVDSSSARLAGVRASFPPVIKIEGGGVDFSSSKGLSSFEVALSSGRMRVLGGTFRDISGKAAVSPKGLELERLDFRWGNSRLRLAGRLSPLRNPRSFSFWAWGDYVQWAAARKMFWSARSRFLGSAKPGEGSEDMPWVKIFKYKIPRRFPSSSGRIRLGRVVDEDFAVSNMVLDWRMQGISPSLRYASGRVAASMGPGRINDIQSVQDSSKILKILLLPYVYMYRLNSLSVFSAATAYPKSFAFSTIAGSYAASKGVVTTRYFYVKGPELAAFASGSADFAKETVDMEILTRLMNYKAPLPEYLVDEEGRPAIAFRVRGDLNHPNIELRLRKMAAGEIERSMESSGAGRMALGSKGGT